MALGNKIKVEQVRLTKVPVDVTKTIYPGYWLKWDSANKYAQPTVSGDAANATTGAALIGVANDQQPIASLGGNLPFGQMNVIHRGLVEFTADDNAVYYPGDAVCVGSVADRVKKTGASGGAIAGYVSTTNHFDSSAGAPTGITAVSGTTKLLIEIRPALSDLASLA